MNDKEKISILVRAITDMRFSINELWNLNKLVGPGELLGLMDCSQKEKVNDIISGLYFDASVAMKHHPNTQPLIGEHIVSESATEVKRDKVEEAIDKHAVKDDIVCDAEEPKAKSRSLYQIGMDLDAIEDIMEGCGGDVSDEEVDQIITAWMTENQESLAEKADKYANLIEFFNDRAERRKERAKQIAALAKSDASQSKRLCDRLFDFMIAHSIPKIESDLRKITILGCSGKQVLKLNDSIPVESYRDDHQKSVTTISADNDAIRASIEAGDGLTYAEILPRGKRLSIK